MFHFGITTLTLFFLLAATPLTAEAAVDALPFISGENKIVRSQPGETLMEIALREGYGFENIANSNQQHDPWHPPANAEVILPGKAITPSGAKQGIVINLAELRLFHITRNKQQFKINIYPLGIGREGRETPEGEFRIIVKKEKPNWRVPPGLRAEDRTLPEIVPPGPNNPLGKFWLGLSARGYGVHGTNRPYGVGRRISYGCLRMYPSDIATLYKQIDAGTPAIISYQPIKAVQEGKWLLLEVHPDYLERYKDSFQQALTVISRTGWSGEIDYAKVKTIVEAQRGLPEVIGVDHRP
jgi:L,D-transpeptidase ErfK/SrfK